MKNMLIIVPITTAIMIDDTDGGRVTMIMALNKTILMKTEITIKIKTIITVI